SIMLKNMSIGKRLALGFGLVVLLLVAIGVSGYWGIEAITHETLKVLGGDAKVVIHAARVKATTLELRRFEKDTFLNVADAQIRNQYITKWETRDKSCTKFSVNSKSSSSPRTTRRGYALCNRI